MGRADEEIAEAEGRRWRENPSLATHLDAVQRWRELHATSPLLEVLGRPEASGWNVGQDYALGQLLAHLRAGNLLLAEVDLAAANTTTPSRRLLQAALRPEGHVHATVNGELFLRFPLGFMASVRQLWAPVPDTRSLATPSTIPVLLGSAAPSAVLAELRAQTAVARWPTGHRVLSVLLTHPGGAVLRVRYPPRQTP